MPTLSQEEIDEFLNIDKEDEMMETYRPQDEVEEYKKKLGITEDYFDEGKILLKETKKDINYLLWFQYVAVVVLFVVGLFAEEYAVNQYYLALGAFIGKLGFDYRKKKEVNNESI